VAKRSPAAMIAMSKSLVLLAALGSKALGQAVPAAPAVPAVVTPAPVVIVPAAATTAAPAAVTAAPASATTAAAITAAATDAPGTLVDTGGFKITTAGEADPASATTKEPVIVVPPSDVVCPEMTAFRGGTYLHMAPWSFLRTIHVMQKNPLGAADTQIGTITAKLGSWSVEYELNDPINHKLIATFVNPPGFWETAQKIFDCKGTEIAEITWKLTGEGTFLHRYTEHKVFDPVGNHIADLHEEDKSTPKNFLSGFTQTFIYLRDTAGHALCSMRHPEEGFKFLMLKGEDLTATIDMLSFDMLAPKPSMDPEFLSLVFANNLASSSRFGPGIDLILMFFWMFLFCGCCVCNCCSSDKGKVAATKAQEKVQEEKEGLLATRVNSDPGAGEKVQAQGRSMFACCSRNAGAADDKVKAPAPK